MSQNPARKKKSVNVVLEFPDFQGTGYLKKYPDIRLKNLESSRPMAYVGPNYEFELEGRYVNVDGTVAVVNYDRRIGNPMRPKRQDMNPNAAAIGFANVAGLAHHRIVFQIPRADAPVAQALPAAVPMFFDQAPK